MLIENPEALKEWLTNYLPPLCDADPEVLAKYCLALVRKDRPNKELRASMMEQLDVFLKTNTEEFVDKFLQVTKSKSYLPKDLPSQTLSSSMTTTTATFSQAGNSPDSTTSNQPSLNVGSIPSPTLPPLPPLPPISSIPHPPPETTPPYPPKKDEVSSSLKSKKSDSDREKEEAKRGRRRSRSRGHSGSRSRDKATRSRSRDRLRRSRSRGHGIIRIKYDERRRRSPMKRHRRSRSRSRSPRWSRSPTRRSRSRDEQSRPKNKSRSLSPLRLHRSRSRSPIISSHPTTPHKESPHKDDDRSPSPDAVTNSSATKIHSVLSVAPTQNPYSSSLSRRCRDYDVQGFCMRGDQCPFDHGADRVVLEGGAMDFPPPLQGVPPLPSVVGVRYPLLGVHNAGLPPDIAGRPFMRPPPLRPSQFGEYTPNNPSLWGEGMSSSDPYFGGRGRGIVGPPLRFPAPPPPLPVPAMDRELINVPVNGATLLQKPGIRPSLAERLGPVEAPKVPATRYGLQSDNCTLELKKIPTGLNTISHLNQHFFKFGTITNIQVHHGGDPEAALVTFASHSEASAAYRSTEAVFNNRFIKLFWHTGAKSDVTAIPSMRTVHERLSVRNPNKSLVNKLASTSESNDKVMMSGVSLVKTVYNPSALKAAPETDAEYTPDIPSQKSKFPDPSSREEGTPKRLTTVEMRKQEIDAIHRQQELLKAEITAKNKVEKQKAEAMKLKNEVELRTRQLLKEQMQHVKLLVNKLEKNKATMKPEEIRKLMETIKSLQAAVESTKTRLVCMTDVSGAKNKSKVQLDKEILDTELEMYTVQSEGRDITCIRTRLHKLKSELALLKARYSKSYITSAPSGAGSATLKPTPYLVSRGGVFPRGIGGFRGRIRGRGCKGAMIAVDRRTTRINASGFEREDKEQVVAHFLALGNMASYDWDDLTPSISIQYTTRKEAEKAIAQGRVLGDRLLTITWVAAPITRVNPLHISAVSPDALTSGGSQKVPMFDASTPHSSVSIISNEDGEEIMEEIVEEETEEIRSFFEDELEEEDEEEGRSWRR